MILRARRTVSLQTTRPWSVTNLCQTDLYPTSLPLSRSSCSIAVNTVLTSEELCRLLRPLRARILFSCRKLSSRSCSRRRHSNISAWLYPSLKYCSMSSSRNPRSKRPAIFYLSQSTCEIYWPITRQISQQITRQISRQKTRRISRQITRQIIIICDGPLRAP